MAARIQQPAVIMLAVNLDQAVGDIAQDGRRHARAAGEGAAAAVGLERSSDQQRFAGLRINALLPQKCECRMLGWQFEFGRHAGLLLALPDQSGIGPDTERQSQAVEQDRFACAGLAGQHAKARLERQFEPVDQHHVADRQLPQHAAETRLNRWAVQQPTATCRWINR